jgi:hypothetical protein
MPTVLHADDVDEPVVRHVAQHRDGGERILVQVRC